MFNMFFDIRVFVSTGAWGHADHSGDRTRLARPVPGRPSLLCSVVDLGYSRPSLRPFLVPSDTQKEIPKLSHRKMPSGIIRLNHMHAEVIETYGKCFNRKVEEHIGPMEFAGQCRIMYECMRKQRLLELAGCYRKPWEIPEHVWPCRS